MPVTPLAISGGPRSEIGDLGDLFAWPLVTADDEAAVLDVLRRGAMSDLDVTLRFEDDLREWFGVRHAVCHSSGTAALQTALWAAGVRRGDEVLCQSMTYWASCLPVFSLGATVVFAELHPETLTLDPADLEHRITPRTKAIVVVHYCGHPADMDPLMGVARRHGLKVIEDVSHAQGGLYRGQLLGTIGDVGALSVMSKKALSCGEGGVLLTDDPNVFEHAIAFGHYRRTATLEHPALVPFRGMPLGGCKYRMHQMTSAVGRVQLRRYRERMAVIQDALNAFWDRLEGVPGLRAHRPPRESGSTMGGWHAPKGLYVSDELGGLSVARFCDAVTAELAGTGFRVVPGANALMHLHPVLNDADVYGDGRPTRLANSDRELRQPLGSLPVTEQAPGRCFSIPPFKRDRRALVERFADAYRKVAEHAEQLR
jgi:perosamine synthetase